MFSLGVMIRSLFYAIMMTLYLLCLNAIFSSTTSILKEMAYTRPHALSSLFTTIHQHLLFLSLYLGDICISYTKITIWHFNHNVTSKTYVTM